MGSVGTAMTKAILTVSILAGLTLAGCATEYGPMGLSGGYWDRPLASDMFQVGFKGNGFTSPDDAYAYSLRHAAEVTTSAGFKYFVILDENQAEKSYQVQTEGSYQSYTNGYGYTTGTYTPGDTYTVHKPRMTFVIKCFNEKPDGNSFDAWDVRNASSRSSP
jgi:hypothetical protein